MKQAYPKYPAVVVATPRRRRFGTEKEPPKKRERKPRPSRAKKLTADKPKQEDHFEDILAPHHFTDEEKARLSGDLVRALDHAEELAAQAKQAAQDFKLRITNETNKVTMLRAKLNSGVETREMRARVEFEPKRKNKKYFNPDTGDFIRDEPMQVADWQLPMFKPAPDGKGEEVAPPGAADVPEKGADKKKPGKPTKSSPAGETNIGDAMDATAAKTNTPPIVIPDFDSYQDWTAQGMRNAFKSAAKTAGWKEAQISVLNDRLKECDTVAAMKDTLRPFLVTP